MGMVRKVMFKNIRPILNRLALLVARQSDNFKKSERKVGSNGLKVPEIR
jgi:hypothetical protein